MLKMTFVQDDLALSYLNNSIRGIFPVKLFKVPHARSCMGYAIGASSCHQTIVKPNYIECAFTKACASCAVLERLIFP